MTLQIDLNTLTAEEADKLIRKLLLFRAQLKPAIQGDLSFYRPKWRGDHVLNLEFNQVYTVTVDPEID